MSIGNAIWMYGSSARGDEDHLSDIDILLVGPGGHSTVAAVGRAFGRGSVAVSQYSWAEIRHMASYGSLFLHHVRLEGRVLNEEPCCEGVLRHTLDGLGKYTRARKDVAAFTTVLADVRESLAHGDVVAYELGVLATVLRHAAILGCWLIGDPRFGRVAPVEHYARARELDRRGFEGFLELYKYRLYLDRRMDQRDIAPVCIQGWLGRAECLVASLGELAG